MNISSFAQNLTETLISVSPWMSSSPTSPIASSATARSHLVPTEAYFLENGTNGTNGTEPGGEEEEYRVPYSPGLIILLAILSCTITTVTIIGNTLILVAFFTTKNLRRLTTYFYASLAISDLTAGILVMPFMMSFTLAAKWNFGKAFCIAWLCIDMFVYSASVYHMCMICLDRFLAVRFPFRYRIRRTKKLILTFIVVAWCLALLTEVPATLLYEHVVGESVIPYEEECDVEWVNNVAITMVSFAITVFIPFLFMLILSALIFFTIRGRREFSDASSPKKDKTSKRDKNGNAEIGQPVAETQPHTVKQRPVGLKRCFDCCSLPGKRKKYSVSRSEVALRDTSSPVVSVKFEQKENAVVAFSGLDNEAFQTEDIQHCEHDNQTVTMENGQSLGVDKSSVENSGSGSVPEIESSGEKTGNGDTNDTNDQHANKNEVTSVEITPSGSSSVQNSDVASRQNSNATTPSKRVSFSHEANLRVNRPLATPKPSASSASAQRANERKAATTMGILLGVFLFTWLPWKVTTIADAIANKYLFPDLWYDLAIWLQYSNSMINPFLYVLRERNFKIAIGRILCRVFCCKKVRPEYRRSSSSSVVINSA
ncbi:histamine H1 receptor-like [Ptychodera flava]|uniref:histamine H1 receptor-like n=1 Tax=Ptychodera flava TaxID=63121 RepID=UPI00396A453B